MSETQLVECHIGLGSNIGNPMENIEAAIQEISNSVDIKVEKVASLYLTKAWGKTDQQNFVNTAIIIKTNHKPIKLLELFQKIEKQLGRVKIEKWGPRLIDIDILLYGQLVVNEPLLKIPHPYLTQRSFVLAPLHELNEGLMIPELGKIENFIDEKQLKEDILEVF